MSLPLYMDVHVRRAVTAALLERGIDVITAQADDAAELDDPDLLSRSTELGRVMFSQDQDMLIEATHRQRHNIPFAGLVYAHQLYVTVGQCIRDLEMIATLGEPDEFRNRVHFLPL